LQEILWQEPEFTIFGYWADDGNLHVHAEVRKWSPSAYKQGLVALQTLHNETGLVEIYTVIPDDDPKLEKYENMLGFVTIKKESNMLLMRRSICHQ